MKEYAYGIVKYNTKNNKRMIVRNSCSKDTFKRLAKKASGRFKNFSYNSDNNSFVAGDLIFRYEWFPDMNFNLN